jgi:hypothetical protein
LKAYPETLRSGIRWVTPIPLDVREQIGFMFDVHEAVRLGQHDHQKGLAYLLDDRLAKNHLDREKGNSKIAELNADDKAEKADRNRKIIEMGADLRAKNPRLSTSARAQIIHAMLSETLHDFPAVQQVARILTKDEKERKPK